MKLIYLFISSNCAYYFLIIPLPLGTKGPQIGDDVLPDKATFYSIDQNTFQNPRVQLRPISISNGLTWSLNKTVLYYIDSPTQKLEAFDFDPYTGDLSKFIIM